ncbi:MAG: NAD(P)-dependent oxidoreductase, partial [Bacteroidota bacterium]
MKILITGATGSLGAYLVRYFANQGHEIIASGRMTTPPAALMNVASEYVQADINDPVSLPAVEVVIHAAARSDDQGKYADFHRANVMGTRHVLQAVHCQTFIQVSSSSVYYPSGQALREADAGRPRLEKLSHYGATKYLSEKEVEKAKSFERAFILRPRVLYG